MVVTRSLALGLLLACGLAGCVVSPREQVWACASSADCIDGWVCAAPAGDTERTCVPACQGDTDCPSGSICLPSHTCAETCTFASDGNPIEPCSSGLECARLRYPLGTDPQSEGLCVAAETCTTNTDCGEAGYRCASSDTTQLRGLSNLPCVPVGGPAGCPSGYVQTTIGCLARCDDELASIACPPAMTCHEGSLVSVGARESESACYFGFYGAPCRDDTECFVGRCTDVGDGRRQCTETCDAAAFISLQPRETACATLLSRAGALGARLVFTCSSEGADGVCVARGGVGSGCRSDGPGPDDECAEGLECRGGLCTRACEDTSACVLADTGQNPLANGFCDGASGLCLRLSPESSTCADDAECVTGLCASPPLLTGEDRCRRPRRVNTPCERNAECLSGTCGGTPRLCR